MYSMLRAKGLRPNDHHVLHLQVPIEDRYKVHVLTLTRQIWIYHPIRMCI